jgi:hypothetical protein
MEMDLSDADIKAMGFQYFLDSEDFAKRVRLFGISDFKRQSQHLDFGFKGPFRETSGGAIDTDLDLSAEGQALGILHLIEDPSSDIIDEALELHGLTLLTEVSAALVVRVGGKESTVGREDVKGEKTYEANDLNQDLRDFDIEGFSQAIFEVSEIGIRWDMRRRDTGIEAIMFSFLIIPEDGEESFQIGELLQISEQFQKEEAGRIVGMSSHGRIG